MMRDNLTGGGWVQRTDLFASSGWHTGILPLSANATSMSVRASKSFGANGKWLVDDTGASDMATQEKRSLVYCFADGAPRPTGFALPSAAPIAVPDAR